MSKSAPLAVLLPPSAFYKSGGPRIKTINGYGYANVSELGLHFGKCIKKLSMDMVMLIFWSVLTEERSSEKKNLETATKNIKRHILLVMFSDFYWQP